MGYRQLEEAAHSPGPQDKLDVFSGDGFHGLHGRNNQVPRAVAAVVPEAVVSISVEYRSPVAVAVTAAAAAAALFMHG